MMIRTLIVDDEAPARGRLQRLLSTEADIEIVGEAVNGADAVERIGELRPMLLFLDVQMPAIDGLGVLRAVRDTWMPCTIFTTAFSEHALAAFDLHAIDYLLKPYSRARFSEALDHARRYLHGHPSPSPATSPEASPEPEADPRIQALLSDGSLASAPSERFLVRNNERYTVVRAADIEWVEAAANYVVLHTPTGNHVLRRSLGAIEAELDPKRFFRSSRSAIVALRAVQEVQALTAGDHIIQLASGARVPLTRGLRELQEKLRFAT